MDFYELLDDVLELLRRRGRVTYRALKRQFHLDDDVLDDLKEELIKAQRVAVDENGDVLVWVGDVDGTPAPTPPSPQPVQRPVAEVDRAFPIESPAAEPRTVEAERRQLIVLFCDLVDSTALSSRLDPEDLRGVVQAYQEACAKVIARYEGYTAQYLGDGLLVYFSYPRAHEDDAQRAVRAGLGMVEAMGQLNARLSQERGVSLVIRLGIHTSQVVVGEIGGGAKHEQLALGETPNVAARLQGIATPNTLVISATTFQLLGGFFACQSLGPQLLKGVAQPVEVYEVRYESTARSRLEAAGGAGLTPLVGREQEMALLRERWAQVKDGTGQVVLLGGEAGIGKSRLVHVLQAQVASEPQTWLTPCQCSPYHQNTALYPLIDLLERVALRFDRDETPQHKLNKLEGHVVQYGLPLAETVPLLASLLSLPLPADYAPLRISSEQQKQQTMHVARLYPFTRRSTVHLSSAQKVRAGFSRPQLRYPRVNNGSDSTNSGAPGRSYRKRSPALCDTKPPCVGAWCWGQAGGPPSRSRSSRGPARLAWSEPSLWRSTGAASRPQGAPALLQMSLPSASAD